MQQRQGSPVSSARLLLVVVVLAVLSNCVSCQRVPKYYQLLDVKANASDAEIKKAYRAATLKYHPDKNKDAGASEKYQEINAAYEVLKDRDLRRVYDQSGEEGVQKHIANKQQGGQGNDAFDIFGGFFGGGGQRQRDRRGPELKIKLSVTLEDIYNGSEVPFFLTKQVLCPHCRGSGADDPDHVKTCPVCKGQGNVIKKQQIAPGYFQQFQTTCDKCGGKGKTVTSKCHVCKAAKTISGTDEMSVFIEKGIAKGQTIKFEGGGDEYVDMSPSDIVFEIVELPHPAFERRETHLHVTVKLTLQEALLGFKKKIKHLDGHFVKIEKNGVTQPEEVQRISGEGMPLHQQSSTFGDLFIRYRVQFKPILNDQEKKALQEFFSIVA